MLLCLVLIVRIQHQRYVAHMDAQRDGQQLLPVINNLLDGAAGFQAEIEVQGTRLLPVMDSSGNQIGLVARTLPDSNHVLGFSGPSDLLLVFDNQHILQRAVILSSGDTRDHVQRVRDSGWLEQLQGRTLSQLQSGSGIDAVSGATLTSLAMRESIEHRLQGTAGRDDTRQPAVSLRFPDPPQLQQVRQIFAQADSLAYVVESNWWQALDDQGQVLGSVLRSAPSADNIIGYQGPSDSLLAVDNAGRIVGIGLGASYDNEPYIDYVRTDRSFRKLFRGQSLEDVSKIDLQQAGIEGVSGATMTSQAVAEGIVLAARAHLRGQQPQTAEEPARQFAAIQYFNLRNLSTVGIGLFGICMGLSGSQRARKMRGTYRILVIVWLGLMNGDLLSQAMLAGWMQNGVPWQHATGLVCLALMACLVPLTTGKNLYCSHVCPHGAVQQLLRRRLPWRLSIPRRLEPALRLLPMGLLLWILCVVLLHLDFSLVDIEPFDAWLFKISGLAATSIAIVGLGSSLFVPMAYCRYGCPTGKVLDYLRFSPRDRWTIRDTAAMMLLSMAIGLAVTV